MASNLKTQLKQLLAAKEYRAAIVLLENSDLPDKQTYIDRIKARMKADAPAPEVQLKSPSAKPLPFEEEKPKPAKRRGCLFYVGIAVLVLVVLSIPVGIYVKNGIDLAFLRTGFWSYCIQDEKSSDCDAWRDANWSRYEAVVRQCDKTFGYPEYDHAFYACLRDAGV